MASTSTNGSYHTPAKPGNLLQVEYADVKARYWQMEESYRKRLDQEKQRPDIVLVREKLLATRSTCVELASERNALLDRIIQLELNAAAQAHQQPINGSLGTERESRFRDRITSALSQTTDLNSDPYTNSTHCGPAAIQEYQQRHSNTPGDKSTGPEFDSTAVGKGSPSKRPAGRGSKTATVDESPSAPGLVPAAPAPLAPSATTSHPSELTPQPVSAIRPIPKIRVKPIAPQPPMNAPPHVPSSNSLSNLLDGNSTYRDSTMPSEPAPVAPEGPASS